MAEYDVYEEEGQEDRKKNIVHLRSLLATSFDVGWKICKASVVRASVCLNAWRLLVHSQTRYQLFLFYTFFIVEIRYFAKFCPLLEMIGNNWEAQCILDSKVNHLF